MGGITLKTPLAPMAGAAVAILERICCWVEVVNQLSEMGSSGDYSRYSGLIVSRCLVVVGSDVFEEVDK